MTATQNAETQVPEKKIYEGELNTYYIDSSTWVTVDNKFIEDLIPSTWFGKRVRITIELLD